MIYQPNIQDESSHKGFLLREWAGAAAAPTCVVGELRPSTVGAVRELFSATPVEVGAKLKMEPC